MRRCKFPKTFLTKSYLMLYGDMSHTFKISKDYHNFLNSVTENIINTVPDSANQELWIKMGTQLEVDGVPKEQISTIMRKDIEQILYDKIYYEFGPREDYKWHNGAYWRLTKKHGWINSDMARNLSNDLDPSGIKEIVPSNNREMMLLCYDYINLCRILIDKSKDIPPLEDIFGKKTMKEFYKQQETILNNCKNAIDNKTKVPKNTELFLLECLATVLGNVHKCVELFMNNNLILLRKQGKFFTSKQSNKFQKGMKQSQQLILKPTSRDFAIFLDYSGVQCVCGSWRNRDTPNFTLECFDCDKIFSAQHFPKCTTCYIPLYKERLVHIVKTGKCENCDELVDLPAELIECAKS